jgi:exopolyphosphatase / guanosine-5'-triphosphate,3'-diphosphate pyrophosphatase
VTRVAAVDCGTNSLRLLVADVSDGVLTDVRREMRVVRLGEGVDRTGVLAPQALERTRAALADYAETCRVLAVERTRMVATSATRDATNRDEFTSLVQDVLGIPPEVVSGADEAALSFDGATRGLDAGDGPFLVVDIGGGSTEFVLGAREVEAAVSVDVGCVRLTERHLRDDPPTSAQVAAAEDDVDTALAQVRETVPVERARLAVGLAGSVTTVAAHALRLPAYQAERTHLARLDAVTVVDACSDLLTMSREQRAALPYMHPGRVDVIGAGALVLRTIVERLALPEVLVSEADILDGIAWSLVGERR